MDETPVLSPLRTFVRQIDLATLDLFVLICQTGSIGAAADQGQLAISSVSKRIKELETAVRTPLLVRHAGVTRRHAITISYPSPAPGIAFALCDDGRARRAGER